MLRSLRHRILLAFGLVIVSAIAMSSLVAVWSAEHQLEGFISDINRKQAAALAGMVEAEYNRTGHLDSLDNLLNSTFTIRYRSHEGAVERGHDDGGEHHFSVPLYDWSSGAVVGYLAPADHEAYSDESSAFTRGTFINSLYGGLITALLAFVISVWLANRINAPVLALTKAATRLAESGDTDYIEVHSDDELGQMSAAFNRMADALDAQQKIRQQLIADISHELNTPLSIIRLETQGMVDGMQSPAEAAANILREIDLLRGLIADLELMAEADQKALQLALEPVAVADFLTTVKERWQSEATAKGLQFQLTCEALPPRVSFDPNRVRQVLGNLIRNALQHTEEGGQITLAARATPTHLTLSVSDTGRGIAPEHLPRLFERFYRFDDTGQRISRGRGLGLAIVKQLVDLHQGEVRVTSALGMGSTFYVSLPRR